MFLQFTLTVSHKVYNTFLHACMTRRPLKMPQLGKIQQSIPKSQLTRLKTEFAYYCHQYTTSITREFEILDSKFPTFPYFAHLVNCNSVPVTQYVPPNELIPRVSIQSSD